PVRDLARASARPPARPRRRGTPGGDVSVGDRRPERHFQPANKTLRIKLQLRAAERAYQSALDQKRAGKKFRSIFDCVWNRTSARRIIPTPQAGVPKPTGRESAAARRGTFAP